MEDGVNLGLMENAARLVVEEFKREVANAIILHLLIKETVVPDPQKKLLHAILKRVLVRTQILFLVI